MSKIVNGRTSGEWTLEFAKVQSTTAPTFARYLLGAPVLSAAKERVVGSTCHRIEPLAGGEKRGILSESLPKRFPRFGRSREMCGSADRAVEISKSGKVEKAEKSSDELREHHFVQKAAVLSRGTVIKLRLRLPNTDSSEISNSSTCLSYHPIYPATQCCAIITHQVVSAGLRTRFS